MLKRLGGVNLTKKPMQFIEEEILGEGICAGRADRAAKRIRTFSASSSRDVRKVRAFITNPVLSVIQYISTDLLLPKLHQSL
jgi:hypothetical protein